MYVHFKSIMANPIGEICQNISMMQEKCENRYEWIFLDVGDEIVKIGETIETIDCTGYLAPRKEIEKMIDEGLKGTSI